MKNSRKHKSHPDRRRLDGTKKGAEAEVRAAQLHRDLVQFDRGEPGTLGEVVSERLKEGEKIK